MGTLAEGPEGSRHDGLILLLIVDEVHHFGGGLRDEALEMAMADARLGLSPTPPRGAGAATRLSGLVGPTVFELAVGDLAGGFLASFDAITLSLDLSPEERSAYTSLSAAFTGAYGGFRRAAPDARWTDFSQHAARTPEGRCALAAWRQMQRLLAVTDAKRRANTTAASRNVSPGSSGASRRSGMWFASRSRSPLTAG